MLSFSKIKFNWRHSRLYCRLHINREVQHPSINCFFLKRAIPGLFIFYFRLFNTIQLTVNNKCSIKICRCLDSNRGRLVLEATALPTEPQPLPTLDKLLFLCRGNPYPHSTYSDDLSYIKLAFIVPTKRCN